MLVLLHLDEKTFCLHVDDWYENLRLYDEETEKVETKLKIAEYKSGFAKSKLSPHRMEYLVKTIEDLKQYGRVVLVRMPSSKDMYALESEYMPSFDSLMYNLAVRYAVKYYDFGQTSGEYKTFDGNHLIPKDAQTFTQCLCDSLKE